MMSDMSTSERISRREEAITNTDRFDQIERGSGAFVGGLPQQIDEEGTIEVNHSVTARAGLD